MFLWIARRFASKSAAVAVYILAGISILSMLGVGTKPLVAGLGVGGFASATVASRVDFPFQIQCVQGSMLAQACYMSRSAGQHISPDVFLCIVRNMPPKSCASTV